MGGRELLWGNSPQGRTKILRGVDGAADAAIVAVHEVGEKTTRSQQ